MPLSIVALAPSEGRTTFRISGLTSESFTSAPVGARSMESASFASVGYEWMLEIYLGGRNEELKGHVSVFLFLQSRATTTEELCFTVFPPNASSSARSLTSSRKWTTIKPCPEGLPTGGFGWGTWVSHAEVLAQPTAYIPGGVFSFSISIRVRLRVLLKDALDASSSRIPPKAVRTASTAIKYITSGQHRHFSPGTRRVSDLNRKKLPPLLPPQDHN